jgi:hypothetical protein
MAYAPTAVLPRNFTTSETAPRAKRNLVMRMVAAIQRSQMQRAEQEIARYFASRGNKLTDEVEREIERRYLARR